MKALTRPDRYLPAAVVVLGAAVLTSYSLGQWRSMYVPSWDLAIFSQLAKDYAGLQAPIVPIKGEGFNLLGDHFHPILVLLAPAWWIAPSPLTLLIVQNLLLAVSAWPITRLAIRLVGTWAGTALGGVYVLSWGFQGAVASQFHEIAFAVPMLAWASVAFVERRWWACALWCLPLVLVKEDLGLTVLMAGLAIAVRGWQERRPAVPAAPTHAPPQASWERLRARALAVPTVYLGLALAVFGAVAFLVTVLVLLPALSPSGTWEYGIGGNAGDRSASSANPDWWLARLFIPEIKLRTLGMVVATAGVAGMASPWFALVAPTLAWRFLSGKEFYWDWAHWHYNAILIPIALAALLDVLHRLKTSGGRSRWMDAPLAVRYAVIALVAVPLLTSALTAKDLPLIKMGDKGWGLASERAYTAQKVIDLIEPGSTVETDLGLLAYLVPTTTVYWTGTSDISADYVVIDSQSTAWGGNPPADAAAWAMERSPGTTYRLVLSDQGYQVAQRVD